MHIKSLKIFCDIVQRRSFSRAAAVSGISQSSASQAVHQLEERLGVRLLDRSKRPFVLTPEGERYYDGCRQLVKRYEDLESEVRSLHQGARTRLTVASIYSVGLAHMSQYLRDFLAHHPQVDVRLEYLHPQRVVEAVANEEADLGLVSYPRKSHSLAAIEWRSEPFVVVCSPEHRLSRRREVSLESLQGEPFVAFQPGLTIRDELDRAFVSRDIVVDIALEFDNIETIKRAIEIGTGVSLLPEPTVAREVAAGSLVKVPLKVLLGGEQLSRPLGILHRRDRKLSPTASDFIKLLQTRANKHDDPATQPRGEEEPVFQKIVGGSLAPSPLHSGSSKAI